MNNEDQQQLEVLYEQVTTEQMYDQLFPEENQYFDLMADYITDEVYKAIKKTPYIFRENRALKYIGKVYSYDGKDFIDKQFPQEFREACFNVLYHNVIHANLLSFVKAKFLWDKDQIKVKEGFAFNKPDMFRTEQIVTTVDKDDKEKFKQTLKKWFVLTLKYLSWYYDREPSFRTWEQWRKQKLAKQTLTQKLPELEGLI